MGERIAPSELIPMDVFTSSEPILIDLVYADAAHPENIFQTAVYTNSARLTLHKDLARIVLKAARILHKKQEWVLVLKDGLRPVEAQAALAKTGIVLKNPHWMMEPNRLLSGPGQGAHPRGMAIDVSVLDGKGCPVDMGTLFDAMVPESARNYTEFSHTILQNRKFLEDTFTGAALDLGLPLLPLPSEWWDFRFPADYHKQFDPIQDRDLPPSLKMCEKAQRDTAWDNHNAALAKSILLSL